MNFLQSTGLRGSTGPTQVTKGGMPSPEQQISREAPRVYQASSLEAGQEWALERGQLGEELFPHCPKGGKLLAPSAKLKYLPIPDRLLCRASSFLNGAAGGSEPIKNGELNTHELKNIYKVLFLGSSLSFSTVQSRVVWGKVGKRTIENVLWEAPQQNPEFRTEPTESGFWYSGAGNRGLYSPRVTVTAASPENTPANKTTFLVLFQLWLKFLLQRQVTRK